MPQRRSNLHPGANARFICRATAWLKSCPFKAASSFPSLWSRALSKRQFRRAGSASCFARALLLFRRLVAAARRGAAGEMHKMLIGTGRAHGAKTPVGGAGRNVGKPVFGVLRSGAIGVLGAQALAGRRGTLVDGGTHRGFLSAAVKPGCDALVPVFFPGLRVETGAPRFQVTPPRWGRAPFVRRPAEWCDRRPPGIIALCMHSSRAAWRWSWKLGRQR